MSPTVIQMEEGFVPPKERPLWPTGGVAHGLRLPVGSYVQSGKRFDTPSGVWIEEFVIALPDGWSATGQARSFLEARRLAVEKVKVEIELRKEGEGR